MIIYGRNPVREAIRGPRGVRRVWATAGARREPWLSGLGTATTAAEPAEIERICGSDAHQGVCAEVEAFRYADADALLAAGPEPLIVALDQVQDPQNLGAVARSAECAGATGLVLPERRSAEVTPAVCKASAGAVEHLPVARVRNLADFLAEAKRAGLWCYGADQGGQADYLATDLSGPLVLVLGSEGRGLRPRVAGACDAIVSISLRGHIESLSVSAAAAVLIFAAAARRQ
ncbi:MAG: rRNA (guanosine2251-2-O)-methyltransferase [Solirubrobacteraceae bacterium]|jgi:23S rRNA (guanosine2251-2'-O)-methyltransferase|nr:rRNA (guanosine2251-2-O)-methyltransferase [Solirubrobacteraceae bacterium]